MTENTQIDLLTAIKWINAWKAKTDIQGEHFRASLIPMEDVTRVKAEINAVDVRGYNAYDEENDKYKLLIVGVDAGGIDIINVDATVDCWVYDLTLPCPDTCNVTSPLFTGILPEQLKKR